MDSSDYKKIATQWREYQIPQVKPRRIEIDLKSDFIWAIIGPRRAGKTYVCFQLMRDLLDKKIPLENIIYVNFEDEKMLGAQARDIQGIIDAFFELYPPQKHSTLYLFLDEIQNVVNWQKWVRRVHEIKKNFKIIVTGSSAKLLSRELATELRGRVLSREVYPLSFCEYLEWQGVKYNLKTIAYSERQTEIKRHFNKWLQDGGYPAVILNPPALRDQILQQYFDNMLLNDVVERYNIKNVSRLRVLVSLLFESVGKDFSFSKTAAKLEALGHKISKNTVVEHVKYLSDAYLFFQNIKFEYSVTKQLGAIKKNYCIDNGLLNAVSFKFSDDIGRLLENAVFLEFKRRGQEIFYHRGDRECDFVIKKKNKIINALQVTKEINSENEAREIKGLTDAMDVYGLKEGCILTLEQRENRKIEDKTVKILPVWEWMFDFIL